MEGCLHAWENVEALLDLSGLIDIWQIKLTLKKNFFYDLPIKESEWELSSKEGRLKIIILIDDIGPCFG